jgi:hypothetical protein
VTLAGCGGFVLASGGLMAFGRTTDGAGERVLEAFERFAMR